MHSALFRIFLLLALPLGMGFLQPSASLAQTPSLRQPSEGDRTVSGTVAEGNKTNRVRIQILLNEIVTYTEEVTPNATTLEFRTGTLNFPLVRTMEVRSQYLTAQGGLVGEVAEAEVAAPGRDYDWGRVHAYFTLGSLLSKGREDFSKTNLYLALNVDNNWINYKNFHLNTYFDARLTAIPVDIQQDQFLSSRKSANISVGAYAPLYWSQTTWTYQDDQNALFIAPIINFGFQSITTGLTTQEAERFGGDDLFNSVSGGARFGLYRLNPDQTLSPELINYVDITFGKWENFEVCPVDEMGNCMEEIRSRTRVGIEGRLKVPATPIHIGIDLNTGHGRDDLRFLFGVKFDIGSLIGQFRSLAGQ